ncbi:hypothetical protein Salat_0680300 [Sesamum alatum]|uniref:Uncharacterized protein n=1 Tax=Sesamum alatum TaxID=300844 RepID=A0AAE2CUP2_9LAMI|nr:hypothetical protein Salat_0680300 [Sesamum alatum]
MKSLVIVLVGWKSSLRHRGQITTQADVSEDAPGRYCGTFQWVDPPMCHRAIEVDASMRRYRRLLHLALLGFISITENEFAKAYWWRGEVNYFLLRSIFQEDNTDEATGAYAMDVPLALTNGNEVSSGDERDVVLLGMS